MDLGDRIKALPPNESLEFTVTFDTAAVQSHEPVGDKCVEVPFNVSYKHNTLYCTRLHVPPLNSQAIQQFAVNLPLILRTENQVFVVDNSTVEL